VFTQEIGRFHGRYGQPCPKGAREQKDSADRYAEKRTNETTVPGAKDGLGKVLPRTRTRTLSRLLGIGTGRARFAELEARKRGIPLPFPYAWNRSPFGFSSFDNLAYLWFGPRVVLVFSGMLLFAASTR